MTKRPFALADLTFGEFKARMQDDPVIVLPLGSQEEQGPLVPMGDYALAEAIAMLACEKAGALCAPVLPFGYAEFFRGMPGGIQLRAETFCRVLEDMITAFTDHGLKRIVICNGHSTNAALISQVAHKVRQQTGVVVPSLNLWRLFPDEVWSQAHGDHAPHARGHGADPVTSVAMHLTPHLVQKDDFERTPRQYAFDLPIVGQFTAIRYKGADIDVPLDVCEVALDGIGGGDPRLCNAAAGKVFTDWLVTYLADFLTFYKTCDPTNPSLSAPF